MSEVSHGCGGGEATSRNASHPAVAYRYNPFEIAIVGADRPTRLRQIDALVTAYSGDRTIAVVTLGAAATAGSSTAPYQSGSTHSEAPHMMCPVQPQRGRAGLCIPLPDRFGAPFACSAADIVLVEDDDGATTRGLPQIVHVDSIDTTKLDGAGQALRQPLVTYCGQTGERPRFLNQNAPYVRNDDIAALRQAIDAFFNNRILRIPIHGLVLTGGRSTRMRRDKAALQFHGKSQAKYCFDVLTPHCEKVYISNRQDQAEAAGHSGLPQLHDRYVDFGPMGGILTALHEHPNAAWLVLACDLPFVDNATIAHLLRNRCAYRMATAFRSTSDGMPEPLCAVYEPKSVLSFMQFAALGYRCPRKVLMNKPVCILEQIHSDALTNVNTTAEYQDACNRLSPQRVGRGGSSQEH